MISTQLSDREKTIIMEAVNAAIKGPFFSDDDFPILLGLSRSELSNVIKEKPDINNPERMCRMAITNVINNLLGYPHNCENVWNDYISVGTVELERIYEHWKCIVSKKNQTGI